MGLTWTTEVGGEDKITWGEGAGLATEVGFTGTALDGAGLDPGGAPYASEDNLADLASESESVNFGDPKLERPVYNSPPTTSNEPNNNNPQNGRDLAGVSVTELECTGALSKSRSFDS